MTAQRIERIRACLEGAFAPEALEVTDDSHLHVGHEGAKDGRGHFTVRIVAEAFKGANPLERHRMIYDALGDMMTTDIHALRLRASPPQRQTSNS